MTNLLARFAENIFWLGRYLERAENTARILHINETYGRDDPDGIDWRRILRLYSDEQRFDEAYDPGDAEDEKSQEAAAILRFYITDRDNPSSIAATIRAARENARSVRHLISTEMWTHLNILSNQIRALGAKDLRPANLSNLAQQIIQGCQTFEGITEGTLLRGEPWCFYHIGKYIERADQTTRILDISSDRLLLDKDDAIATVHWNLLLRSVSAYHAYRSRHPGASKPQDIAAFLLYDPEFPRAVTLCVGMLTSRLRDIAKMHGPNRNPALENVRRKLAFALETGPGQDLTPGGLHQFLDSLQLALGKVSTAVADAYFR